MITEDYQPRTQISKSFVFSLILQPAVNNFTWFPILFLTLLDRRTRLPSKSITYMDPHCFGEGTILSGLSAGGVESFSASELSAEEVESFCAEDLRRLGLFQYQRPFQSSLSLSFSVVRLLT